MSAAAIEKRIKYIFLLAMFSGLCGLAETIFTSIAAEFFMGIPLFALMILAEGIIFLQAFKSESLEKALNQISVLKSVSIILAAYAIYNLVSYFIRIYGVDFDLFQMWFQIVYGFSAAMASLAIFFTTTTLKTGDTNKFNTTSAVILIFDALLVVSASVVAIIMSEMLIPIIIVMGMFLFLFSFVPKMLGNKIIKGAIIGGIIAGDVGAVVGAIAASKK